MMNVFAEVKQDLIPVLNLLFVWILCVLNENRVLCEVKNKTFSIVIYHPKNNSTA